MSEESFKTRETEDDVEGHTFHPRAKEDESPSGFKSRALDADDLGSEPAIGEDDVEGHSMLPNPGMARQLQQAREREIQQHLKRHEFEQDLRRKGR